MIELRLLVDMQYLFWAHVHRLDSGCWVWTRQLEYLHPRGKGFLPMTHSYSLHYGVEPEHVDGLVANDCCTEFCINPAHLYLRGA